MSLAKREGQEVRVFLMGDAVGCAVRGQKTPDGYYNSERMVRAVVQRFVSATAQRTYQFFIQLELNGLARIGTDPLEALQRNIPGYTRTNAPSMTSPAGETFPSRSGSAAPFGQYH